MKRFTRFILIVLLFATSCSSNEIIPQKKMVPILVKIYLTDATIMNSDYRQKFYRKDSIEYYAPIIESYGFTSTQFDSSLIYYERKPKELDEIMDKVIFELSKIQTDLEQEEKVDSTENHTKKDLWILKTSYNISLIDPRDLIAFEIPVVGFGNYTIVYDIQVFPDDESENPQFKGYFYYDDKTENGNVSKYVELKYIKDGIKREMKTTLELENTSVTHLKGVILDNSNINKNYRNHVSISNIKVIYKPSTKYRKLLKKIEDVSDTE